MIVKLKVHKYVKSKLFLACTRNKMHSKKSSIIRINENFHVQTVSHAMRKVKKWQKNPQYKKCSVFTLLIFIFDEISFKWWTSFREDLMLVLNHEYINLQFWSKTFFLEVMIMIRSQPNILLTKKVFFRDFYRLLWISIHISLLFMFSC